jgi:kumamolisin
MAPAKTPRRRALPLTALIAAGVLAAVAGLAPWSADHPGVTESPDVIGGPYARLLAQAADLGPARPQQVQLTAALHRPARPANLTDWARQHSLSVRWRDGDSWAIVEGQSQAVAQAHIVE